jgi:hypothetical protein
VVVFDSLGLMCGFSKLGWRFHGFLSFGVSYVTNPWTKKKAKFRVRVSELTLGFKHNMVFSFGFVLFKFRLFLLLYLGFGVFLVQFLSFYISFCIFY